jgi:hypothetical protein
MSFVVSSAARSCQLLIKHFKKKIEVLTFQVFGGEKDAANMMFLDKRPDVWSNCIAIKSHHKQLALDPPLSANQVAAIGKGCDPP